MKKRLIISITLSALLISANVFADTSKKNYFLLRYEMGRNAETHEEFCKTYSVFDNNSSKKWAFGFQFITGENGFMLINTPYLLQIQQWTPDRC